MKTIDEVMICPKCGSDDTETYDTDEIEFSFDGTGHYYVYCLCVNCKEYFKLLTEFKYEITDSWTR